MCCYYCRALSWVYTHENDEATEFLYTNFGLQAAHRNTFLGLKLNPKPIVCSVGSLRKFVFEFGLVLFSNVFEVSDCRRVAGYLWSSITNLQNSRMVPVEILSHKMFLFCVQMVKWIVWFLVSKSNFHGGKIVFSLSSSLGILPDQMHLVHLAIGPDCIVSCLLDWTDSEQYVAGTFREQRLKVFYEHYRDWCETNEIGERASRKVFSVQTLTPDAPGFVELSQKKMNAMACRYMLHWLGHVAKDFAMSHKSDVDMQLWRFGRFFIYEHLVHWKQSPSVH